MGKKGSLLFFILGLIIMGGYIMLGYGGYGCGGFNKGFVLLIVLFILLVIIGCSCGGW